MSPRLAAKAAKLAESAAAKDMAVSGLPPAPPRPARLVGR